VHLLSRRDVLETLEAAEELKYKLAIVSVIGWQFRPPCLRASVPPCKPPPPAVPAVTSLRNSGQTGWNLVNPAVERFPAVAALLVLQVLRECEKTSLTTEGVLLGNESTFLVAASSYESEQLLQLVSVLSDDAGEVCWQQSKEADRCDTSTMACCRVCI